MEHSVDAVLANVLGLNDEPAGTVNGERTDTELHPVTRLFHDAEFHVPPPAAAAPARKVLTVEEIEKQLAARRADRRKALLAPTPEFMNHARATIKNWCAENRDAIIAAGSFEKLFQ